MRDGTEVVSGLPDIADFTIDQLRAAPGSVLDVALARLGAESDDSHDDEFTAFKSSL